VAEPTVSLVTPSFNQVRFIERTLRSVLCQDYPGVEYIVMDAVSTDGTGDVLRKYEDVIDVLVVAPDAGQSDALDRGFRMARGDILGYLNADDCLASASTISQVVTRFRENPWADVVYGQRYYVNEDGELQLVWPYRPFDRERVYRSDYIPQEATFWRREIYQRAGGYVHTGYDFAMDYELWLRFLRAGAHFLSVPDYWGLFRWYPSQKSQALWYERGVPECDRLHEEYLGRAVPEHEMRELFMEHMYGAHPVHHPESYQRFDRCWRWLLRLHHQTLEGVRLDAWADGVPVNPARRKSPRASRAA
jgi:glycosyltransferase involved in cell wall biosynthesis